MLAISTGLFGEGFAEMAGGLGTEVRLLAFSDDEAADLGRVEAAVREFRPRLVTAVHCEAPSGVLNPVGEIGALLARPDLSRAVTRAELEALLDPRNYLGLAETFVDRVLGETPDQVTEPYNEVPEC